MSEGIPIVFWAGATVAGSALLWLGDVVRRRTGGRVRHAEIHLLAWIPTIALEIVMIRLQPTHDRGAAYAFPLVIAGFVYGYFLLRMFNTRQQWLRSEAKLDAQDAEWLKERRRRERIEAYKHKGTVRRDDGS